MAGPGKEGQDFMAKVVYAHLGSRSPRLIVGPGRGLDNSVVSLGGGKAMVVTADPISVIPRFGMELSAWLSVHLIASDLTSSGANPSYAVFSYNFPPSMSRQDRADYVSAIGDECRKLGTAIIAGHTGSYPGGGYTVIGSGIMFGVVPSGGYLTPSMAQAGDVVLMTKHAAIEATGSLALSFPNFVERKIGRRLAKRAASTIRLCSTVSDARAARGSGLGRTSVTSMHDATEGGVVGALEEMAFASRKRFVIHTEKVPVSGEAAAVCAIFGLDPLRTMGEGALLITCRPGRVGVLERSMSDAGISITDIGNVETGSGLVLKGGGRGRAGGRSESDKYWAAYESGMNRALD
jgi:hydrogenase expression/formation protein HypE